MNKKDIDKFTMPLPIAVRLKTLAEHYLDRITPKEAMKFAEWCGARVPFSINKRYSVQRIRLGLDTICQNPSVWTQCSSLDEALTQVRAGMDSAPTNEKENK